MRRCTFFVITKLVPASGPPVSEQFYRVTRQTIVAQLERGRGIPMSRLELMASPKPMYLHR